MNVQAYSNCRSKTPSRNLSSQAVPFIIVKQVKNVCSTLTCAQLPWSDSIAALPRFAAEQQRHPSLKDASYPAPAGKPQDICYQYFHDANFMQTGGDHQNPDTAFTSVRYALSHTISHCDMDMQQVV